MENGFSKILPAGSNANDGENSRAAKGISFIPDFCSISAVFITVIGAQLLAFVVALASLAPAGERWSQLSLISLFIQWIALSSAVVLCGLRTQLNRTSDLRAAIYAHGTVMIITVAISESAYQLSRQLGLGDLAGVGKHTEFQLTNLAISAIVTAFTLRYLFLHHQSRRHIEAESRARVQALQARIRPHFLFNSMNTIASLTRHDPALAEQVIVDLADLFRSALSTSGNLVSLHEELDLARRYLDIEKLRLGERLTVFWDVDGVCENILVPSLLVQPLVENAVYHGIETQPGGGTVSITGRKAGKRLSLTITNPVNSSQATRRHHTNGIAIDNIRARLHAHFGSRADLAILQQDDQYRSTISLPVSSDENSDRR